MALPHVSARFEMVQKQLAAKGGDETPYYTERLPHVIAPALPISNCNSAELMHDLDGRNHYYSTLDEVYYKRVA